MTPLRPEDITLFCEDVENGLMQRLLGAVVAELTPRLPFATIVRVVGVASKNDVLVRTKFARTQTRPKLHALAVRDRDFLTQALVADSRTRAFHTDPQRVMAWPLSRHCIESYLLEDELLAAVIPDVPLTSLRTTIEEAAATRKWRDITRGTLEDLAYRLRKVRQGSLGEAPILDRASAIEAARTVAARMERELLEPGATEALTLHLDALAADMDGDGPLRHRVDGRELLYDVERALGRSRGSLLDTLGRRARQAPPAALVADLRAVLEALPMAWRDMGE